MDRDTFLNRKPVTAKVILDDGSSLLIRKLRQSEVETMTKTYKGEEKALAGLRFIVSQTVVDESGRRMFEDADAARLADVDFETVNLIATEVLRFSGLAVKDDAKNA